MERTREDYNLLILQEISKFVTEHPDQRFHQALLNLGLLRIELDSEGRATYKSENWTEPKEAYERLLKAKSKMGG